MFPGRYYPNRMFAPRYWPKEGADAASTVGGGWAEEMDIFVPGFEVADVLRHADRVAVFVPGFDAAEIT